VEVDEGFAKGYSEKFDAMDNGRWAMAGDQQRGKGIAAHREWPKEDRIFFRFSSVERGEPGENPRFP
jgi:hypothetical protein